MSAERGRVVRDGWWIFTADELGWHTLALEWITGDDGGDAAVYRGRCGRELDLDEPFRLQPPEDVPPDGQRCQACR